MYNGRKTMVVFYFIFVDFCLSTYRTIFAKFAGLVELWL